MIQRTLVSLSLAVLLIGWSSGCSKKAETPPPAATQPAPGPAPTPTADGSPNPANTAPGPLPTPAAPQALESTDMTSTLAELTRELHRTMIGRRLSGSFEEFVQIRNLKVPPPPAGKKYAISKQWKVVLVDQ